MSCVVANKSKDCRKKWMDTEGYEEQNPPEAGPIPMAPGDTFFVSIEVSCSAEMKKKTVVVKNENILKVIDAFNFQEIE